MTLQVLKRADRLVDQLVRPASFVILNAANNWKAVLALYSATILGAAAVFSVVEEGRSLWDGVWWAFITGLSIGYGDIFPVTTAGRVTGIVLAHVVLLVIVPMIIAQITLRLIKDADKFTHDEQEEIKADQDTILRQQALIMAHLGIEDPESTKSV